MKNDLTSWLKAHSVEPHHLDEIVHSAADEIASSANNEGINGQIRFLTIIAGWSDETIIEEIAKQIDAN